MGRYEIGLGLLLLLLVLSIGSCYAMDKIQEPIAAAMEDAAEQSRIGNQLYAQARAASAERAWNASRSFTASLADHQPLEDIEALFAQLPAFADSDPGSYSAVCAELARRIRAVSEAQELSIGSFF